MSQSNVRGGRWVGAFTLLIGAALATSAAAAGCGGKTNDAPADNGDTGVADDTAVAVDTKPAGDTATPKDTGPTKPDATGVDTEPTYDAPGSLFDATIPDVVFDGGKTAAGCYDCTTSQCHDQLAACDSDARCRGFLLCVLVDCKGSTTDTACLLGCASAYDVMSFSDPIVKTVQAILACDQAKCKDVCPSLPGDAGPPGDAPGTETTPADAADETTPVDAADDTTPVDAAAADADAMGQSSGPHHAPMSIDPGVVELMRNVQASFAGQPLVRDGLVDHLATH